MDTLAKRLKWARERHGRFVGHGGATEAANAFGWKVPTYLGHENGDRPGARLDKIKRYAKAYGVRWEWLLDGTGQPTVKAADRSVPIEGSPTPDPLYCGVAQQYGSPYCQKHTRMSFAKGSRFAA